MAIISFLLLLKHIVVGGFVMGRNKTYEDRLSASAFLEAFRRKKNKNLMEELHITEDDVRAFLKGKPKTDSVSNKKGKDKIASAVKGNTPDNG